VPKALSRDKIVSTILTTNKGLKKDFGIQEPRLLVAALNPHAGEEGTMGTEEKRIIIPAIEKAREKGVLADGPFPSDTLFTKENIKKADAIICMYHDQGLIPVKMRGIESAVNVTLGLPFIRTSPGHGTAPDIAWKGIASEKSLLKAIDISLQMAKVHIKRD
jgi:4-hydroxythreonine-4-phosphate dehydrogenase